MALGRLGEAGGILAARDQLVENREAMAQLAPLFLLALFFLRGPLPARKSVARVAGFQLLNLGFLVAAGVYGLAAVPLGVELPKKGSEEVPGETSWAVRDRLKDVEGKMAQLDRESAQGAELPEGANEVRRREFEAKKQDRLRQMEEWRVERAQLAGELERRVKAWEEERGKEKEAMAMRLKRAQQGTGGAAVIYVLLGLHGLVAGFIGRGGAVTGGFPVVSSSVGKVENSVPGALRPKRSVN
ncbi:MAG: hypothetical protein EBS69_06985 [Verrucomicrobia bacterium]|nr:hypothetical protein [Verrucomicrobiota bacterium]